MKDEIINFYETKGVKKLLQTEHNPNYELHGIKVNSRSLIVGMSGGGKTNLLLNLLRRMTCTFGHVHILLKQADEPLYEYLNQQLKEGLSIYTDIEELPELDNIASEEQQLLIFDDQISDDKAMKSKKLKDYYIRGRKKKITQIFISQDYISVPKLIRSQMNYIFIASISSEDELKRMLRHYKLGVDIQTLLHMYRYATRDKMNFLKIDITGTDQNKRFSKNFIEYLQM